MDKKTIKLIERFKPMLTAKEIEDFEKFDEPRFDIKIIQKDYDDTFWDNPKDEFFGKTLRELANNIYDYLYEDYEVWFQDPHLFENESPTISEKYIRYIMALEVDNMYEDFIPLKFRLLSSSFVISLDKEASYDYAKKFFRKFGYFDFIENPSDSLKS